MNTLPARPKKIESATTTAVSAIWLVIGIAALAAAGTALTIITGRTILTFGDADPHLPLSQLPQLLQADPVAGHQALLSDAPLWLRLLCSVGTVVSCVILCLSGIHLRRVIQGLAQGRFFSHGVLNNWKRLGFVLTLGAIVQGTAETLAFAGIFWITTTENPNEIWGSNLQGLSVDFPHWPWWTLLLGIIAQAIYGAFKSGAQLEKDVTGLV